jgi:hypothetical protein
MTQPEPQQKRRSWYVWAIGFVVAFGFGLNFYLNEPAKTAANPSVRAQEQATAARVKVLQQKLDEIEARPIPTIDDYIKNTFDAAPVIDEAMSLVPLQMASVDRFKQEHASNTAVAMTADYALRMFQEDRELLSLMGNEINCARALQALLSGKRLAYYRENVLPLKEKEQRAGKEWAAIAKEAASKGVPWPDYVTKTTKVLE